MNRNNLIIIILLITACLGILSYPLHPLVNFSLGTQGSGYDYFFYYASVNALQNGVANIYGSPEMAQMSRLLSEGRWNVADNHPLPLYLFFLPLSKMDFASGLKLNVLLELSLLAAGALALCRFCIKDTKLAWITASLIIVLSVTSPCFVDNIFLGQISAALACCLCFTFIFASSKNSSLAGIALAISILIKIYPAFLLVYFLQKKDYKVILWTLLTLALLSISAGLQWGFGHYANYFTLLTEQIEISSQVGNQAFMGFAADRLSDFDPGTLKVFNSILIAAALFGLWNCSALCCKKEEKYSILEYSAWLTAIMVVSPLSWSHHHINLIIPLIALIAFISDKWDKQELETKLDVEVEPETKASKNVETKTPKVNSKDNISLIIPAISKHAETIAWAGIIIIGILFTLEGETVTQMWIKKIHYLALSLRIGTIGLIALTFICGSLTVDETQQ